MSYSQSLFALNKSVLTSYYIKNYLSSHLGALYVVVQVVPEGVDEVDGVVSGIGIGVTREQHWKKTHSKIIKMKLLAV